MKVSWSTTGRAHRLSLGELLEGRNRSGSHPFHPAPFAGRTGVRVGARIVGPDHVALPIAPVVLVRHRHLHRLVRPIGIREGLDTSQVLAHGEVPAVLARVAIVGDLLPSLPRPVGQHSADWLVFARTLPDSSCLLPSMW